MASADGLSAPGSATYDSNTLVVGDGTWDFNKNTFLLPNLVGLNYDTMRYNGMGNRFSTLSQYHQLVLGHGILAVITFLFVVPAAVMYARFRPYGSSIHLHYYLNIFAVLLSTVVFVLGWFAVGPSRSLTNPHHGIGVAIYTMILVQTVGGRLVKNIRKKSFRLMLHRWLGRVVALLGIVQIPLGLTLYGSPKYTFILYAIWMAFLLLVYFILSWRHESNRDREVLVHGGRSEADITTSDGKSKHERGWLGPLLAVAGIWALLRRRNRDDDRDRSDIRSRPSSRSRPPEVIPSRRGSDSYFEDEKVSGRTDRRGGGAMNWLLGLAGLVGAGALVKGVRDRRERRRYDDEEYSAVATDTPSRFNNRPNRARKATSAYTESLFSDDHTDIRGGPRTHTPLLPGPGNPADTATVLSSEATRPVTPRRSHARPPVGAESSFVSDYSSYVSPSRRQAEEEKSTAGKGILAAVGLGWLAKKMAGGKDKQAEEERRRMEDERRDGRHGSRYTGDGYSTPTRSSRRRQPPASAPTATSLTYDSGSSMLESRPPGTSVAGPPMPPYVAAGAPPPAPAPVPVPVPGPGSRSHSHSHAHSRSRSRSTHAAVTDPVDMPPMPPDPRGVLHTLRPESGSESFASSGGKMHRRHSSRHRRDGDGTTTADAPSTLGPATEDEDRRRRDRSQAPSGPVSVKVRYHDDRDRNITLRRLTEEEAARARRGQGGRSDSVSSISDSEAPGSHRRYRRDSSSQRTADEAAAERLASEPLSPPTPAFAGRRRAGKDSAYYSGQPGPSGGQPAAGQTVSSIGTESHEAWSAMSPSPSGPAAPAESSVPSAADRRRRRRLERRDQRPSSNTVEFS
ncbi:hypothetical protein GGR52DRAFT_521876 [Hypoxylon sp. FL1284]|nr:hypothetical protein GGR52DRAFT_521876 [Hypoxylon sp. FL1284]